MNFPSLTKLSFVILATTGAFAVSNAQTSFPVTDQAVLRLNGVTVESLTLDEHAESGSHKLFFSDTNTQFFKQTAGVIVFLEPGTTAPTGSFTIGQDSIKSTGVSFSSLSDIFGVNNVTQNDLHRVGYMSGGNLRASKFGVSGQSYTYLVENGSLQDLTAIFLTQEAINAGYTLLFSSDTDAIPETSTTVMLVIGIAILVLLHRKTKATA